MALPKLETLADIIDFAIAREKDSAEGYHMMAGLAKTPGLRELLLDLEKEEQHHRDLLEGLPAGGKKVKSTGPVVDLGLSDALDDEPLTPDMSFQDLLIFAAKKEKKAIDLYAALAGSAAARSHRKLFEFLAGQERLHKLKLEAEYEKHILPDN
jgi:rubrerythrin